MQIMIDIPDEQVNMSLEESKYINEDEGEAGFVRIAMLYTNAQLEFVDVERKTDFCSCKYKILPKGHGRLGDLDMLEKEIVNGIKAGLYEEGYEEYGYINDMDDCVECIKCADTIIEADKSESEVQNDR